VSTSRLAHKVWSRSKTIGVAKKEIKNQCRPQLSSWLSLTGCSKVLCSMFLPQWSSSSITLWTKYLVFGKEMYVTELTLRPAKTYQSNWFKLVQSTKPPLWT
jgi:hypothetical protein